MPSLLILDKGGEEIEEKVEKAYYKMRKRSEGRGRRLKRRIAEWEPKVNEKVLVKTQPMSDVVKGITAKFMCIFEGQFALVKF